MKLKLLTLLCSLALAATSFAAAAEPKETDKAMPPVGGKWAFEPATASNPSLPRVLLIGDSICIGYKSNVIHALAGKAGVDVWPHPLFQSEKLNQQLARILKHGPYDVVHVNLGLHGVAEGRIKPGTYEPRTRQFIQIIRDTMPRVKIIWANTTQFTIKGKPTELDPVKNPTVLEHNRMAAKLMAELNIPVNDFYGLLINKLELGRGDTVHWTAPAYQILANQAVTSILQALGQRVERLPGNPIIRPDMLPGNYGENINGPSLIRVPAWVKNPLGRYYLYFAHHNGKYIRLAYADRLEGPWKIHAPGVLHLTNAPGCRGHIASPDVIVDETRREIRMYFHGPARAEEGQKSFVALSPDGLAFQAREDILGLFYFRVFRHDDAWYALAKGGLLSRSTDGLTKFEPGQRVFPEGEARTGDLNGPGPRHVAVLPENGALWVYYSSIGDAPERIRRARLALTPNWREWQVTASEDVLRPERDWEGATLPVTESKAGAVKGREHALRDPAIFTDTDGRRYLLYSVAGESGIAIAELK